jgi:hypothetical protein
MEILSVVKNLKIFIILILVVGIAGISENVFALSQPNTPCKPDSICVHPGDFLTYSTEFSHLPTTETYTFGNYIGEDKVGVSVTSVINGSKIQAFDILNLKTGFYNETADGNGIPIIVISQTPINVDKNPVGVSEKTQNFNGSKRTIVSAANNTDMAAGEVGYDKETGVLMYLHLTHHITGNPDTANPSLNFAIKYDLINTNMFQSAESQSELQIPSWIKNNAKWWSQGQIGDSEFVKGVQYLIKQGIMKIPSTQANSSLSEQIPNWVKTNAGWWANGQISDNDFIKGIKYLVSSGIIHVQS